MYQTCMDIWSRDAGPGCQRFCPYGRIAISHVCLVEVMECMMGAPPCRPNASAVFTLCNCARKSTRRPAIICQLIASDSEATFMKRVTRPTRPSHGHRDGCDNYAMHMHLYVPVI
jgi:hypothetical protein